MPGTKRVEQHCTARSIGAPRRAGSAYHANRAAPEPLLRLLLDAAAVAAPIYRRAVPATDERAPRATW